MKRHEDMKSADTEQPRPLSLQKQRLRIQQLERQSQAEYSAAMEILEKKNPQKPPRGGKTLGKSLPKPGPTLESIVERERCRLCTLVEQHNGLQFEVRAKESQMLELEQAMKTLELDSIPDGDEHHYDQRVRQLENSLEKMSIKIAEAEKIQKIYLQVREHLSQEVREMAQSLYQLQNSVHGGQTELEKVSQMSQTAVTAVDGTKAQLVQMERQLMVERREMENDLSEKRAGKVKEVEGRLEREREGERRGSSGPQKLKEQGQKSPREGLTEGTDSAPVRAAQQSTPNPSTPQSVGKLVGDIDALREALSCTDLQELEDKLEGQRATREQLQTQMIQCEELVKQRTDTVAFLELQYASLKFSTGPGSERFEQLTEEIKAEQERCGQWEAKLCKAQAVLHGVEQGVDNLYYRMICVPLHKESPRQRSLDTREKLRDIDARLAALQGTASEKGSIEDSCSLDQEKMWSFLEQSTMMEPRNSKRANSPVHNSSSEDTFQYRSQEEDCSLSREEIKRRSIQLMEAHLPKKKAQRSVKKR